MNLHDRFGSKRDEPPDIVIVGPAEPEQAAAFVAELRLEFPVFADPTGEAFRAFELHEGGLRQLAAPNVFVSAAKARLRGARAAGVIGNRRQLPGVVIINGEGLIRFHQIAENASDTLLADDLEQVLSDIKTLDAESQAR